MKNKKTSVIIFAVLFTITAITLGYVALGWVAAFIFTFGYLGGLIIWLRSSSNCSLAHILWPYFITLALFVLHKIEERKMDFFPALSEITGVPAPDSGSVPAILLYAIAMCWLAIPFLIVKRKEFGYFLAWTFFASMGITELAHYVLPFFRNEPYGYFPGMWSVIGLAPAAWWGMYKLSKKSKERIWELR